MKGVSMMPTTNDSSRDPLDDALGAIGQSSVEADPLRAAVLARTVAVIRRRRRLKRGALAAGLLVCYFAGIATMGGWQAGRAWEPPAAAVHPSPVPPKQPRHSTPHPSPKPAAAAREIAAATPTPFESWRNIGDYHLQHSGDISTAVASYSQAIDLATAEERAISPGHDNWLMMALKDARAKEQRNGYSETN
jgi:cytochrome c-type biogenesis protein CcmH/NrfG